MLTPHQSGCHPILAHNIYADSDHNQSLEVRGNFLGISKVFDKVWHKGLLYKTESVCISGNLLNLFHSFSL